jgi:hypothetical protein
MKRMTRRRFFGTATAGAAGGLLATSPASAATRAPLDAAFRRVEVPRIAVQYPSHWHLYPRLMTNVIAPVELFSLSSQAFTPGPSFDESGTPDFSGLGSRDVAITVLGQRLGGGRNYAPGQPVATGISLGGLTGATPAFAGIDQRVGWYLGPAWGYLVFLWSGGRADLTAADAILRSVRPI